MNPEHFLVFLLCLLIPLPPPNLLSSVIGSNLFIIIFQHLTCAVFLSLFLFHTISMFRVLVGKGKSVGHKREL